MRSWEYIVLRNLVNLRSSIPCPHCRAQFHWSKTDQKETLNVERASLQEQIRLNRSLDFCRLTTEVNVLLKVRVLALWWSGRARALWSFEHFPFFSRSRLQCNNHQQSAMVRLRWLPRYGWLESALPIDHPLASARGGKANQGRLVETRVDTWEVTLKSDAWDILKAFRRGRRVSPFLFDLLLVSSLPFCWTAEFFHGFPTIDHVRSSSTMLIFLEVTAWGLKFKRLKHAFVTVKVFWPPAPPNPLVRSAPWIALCPPKLSIIFLLSFPGSDISAKLDSCDWNVVDSELGLMWIVNPSPTRAMRLHPLLLKRRFWRTAWLCMIVNEL